MLNILRRDSPWYLGKVKKLAREPKVGDIYRIVRTNSGIEASPALLRSTRFSVDDYDHQPIVFGSYLRKTDEAPDSAYANIIDGGTIYSKIEDVEWI